MTTVFVVRLRADPTVDGACPNVAVDLTAERGNPRYGGLLLAYSAWVWPTIDHYIDRIVPTLQFTEKRADQYEDLPTFSAVMQAAGDSAFTPYASPQEATEALSARMGPSGFYGSLRPAGE